MGMGSSIHGRVRESYPFDESRVVAIFCCHVHSTSLTRTRVIFDVPFTTHDPKEDPLEVHLSLQDLVETTTGRGTHITSASWFMYDIVGCGDKYWSPSSRGS